MKLIDFDKLLDSLSGYLETKIELIKLDIESEVHQIIAKAVIILFIGIAISLAVVLLSVGVSLLLNDILESNYLGFGIISAFYLLLGLIVYLRRKAIYESVLENISLNNDSYEN